MPAKNQKGFAALFPLIIIGAVFVLVLTFGKLNSNKNPLNTDPVLSESTGGSDSAKDGNLENSGSQNNILGTSEPKSAENSNQTLFGGTSTPKVERIETRFRTPKPSEKPESTEPPDLEELDQTESSAETEAEIETEVKDGTLSAKIKIRKGDNSFQIEQENTSVQVQGNFPVSVDAKTNTLSITTPSGSRQVAVLPESAVENILESGVVTSVSKDSTGRNNIRIRADDNGNPVYEIKGVDIQKLLGLIGVPIDKTAQVSIQSGRIVKIDQTFLSQLLDLISI